MTKTLTTLEILNICAWYKQARENDKKPLNALPLRVQWTLKKNVAALTPVAENFTQFRDDADQAIRNEFIGDDKSYDAEDENGQAIRKIKDECLADFQAKTMEFNQKLSEIVSESNEVEITTMNIDEIVEAINDDGTLTIDDIDMLSFMAD